MKCPAIPRAVACAVLGGLLAVGRVDGAAWRAAGADGFASGAARGVATSREKGGLALAWSGGNLLADPGFEAAPERCPQMKSPYAKTPKPPRGWEHNGLGGNNGAVRQAPFARAGKAWELVDTMSPGEPALLQFVPFTPEHRGTLFVFSVWARTREGTNSEAMIALKFSTRTHWRQDVRQPITVGPRWKQYSVTAAMPKDADELGAVIGPSSYQGQGGIVVDEAFLAPVAYGTRGVYTAEPHDMGDAASVVWRAAWSADTPEGTAAELFLRTGSAAGPDAAWSPWERVDASPDTALRLPKGRYAQFQARLATSGPGRTPVLRSVRLDYGARLGFVAGKVTHARTGAPVAGAAVALNQAVTRTNTAGQYLLGLPAAEVSGTVAALHYLPSRVAKRSLREGARARLDVKLRPDPSWPTFRGGPQRQGCSALSGSLEGFGVAWRYPLGTVGGGQIVAADLDGDGRIEFVLARGGSLSARRADGTLLWQADGWEIGSILGVYDLLGDGHKQIIGLSAGWQPYANGAFTVVDGRDGKVLSRVDTWPDAGDIGHGDTHDHLHGSFSPLGASSCVVADLDKDGKLELMVHPNYHSALMTFGFHDGPTRPKMLWKTRTRFKYDLYCHGFATADVDGDGWPEIVFHDHDLIRAFDGRTGTEKSAADMGCPHGLYGPMACGDVDGDGAAEVVLVPRYHPTQIRNTVALAGWDGKALVRRWSRDFKEDVKTRRFVPPLHSPLADIDGDKRPEVIVQIGADVVVLDGRDGAERWRIAHAPLHEVADIDGDGVAEVVVMKGGKRVVHNGKGGFGPKPIAYPPDWGWNDWGLGELCRLRGAAHGQTSLVDRKGKVRATFPGAHYMTTPVVADLEGDGKLEVLVREPSGLIRVLDATGGSPRPKPFPKLKCDPPGAWPRGGGITVHDLEGDGKAELIFAENGHLVVANADGSVRFRSKEGRRRFPAVGRFDGDEVKDVAAFATSSSSPYRGQWTAYSGKDGRIIWQQDAPASNQAAVWDVNGDGRDEIAGKMGPVSLIDGASGNTLWTAHIKQQCALGLGTFADLDGDGQMEILISGEYSNTAWHTNGKLMWWIGWSSGGAKEHCGAVADVNADGAADFALSSNHGVLYCVDGRDARELWTFAIPQKVSLSHCAAADLDGDGKVEFVFGTNTGKLIVVNGEDGSLARSLDLGHPVGVPIVADTNGDGLAEVLVVSGGTLHCLAARRPGSR